MDPQLLEALRALADTSRLRIAGLLAAGRPMAVEELAAAVGLSARTVVHHLERLETAGLVGSSSGLGRVEYAFRIERLHELGRLLARVAAGAESGGDSGGESGAESPGPEGEALPAYDAQVLRAFVRDGRLLSIPAQDRKRQVVLRYLLDRCFAEDRPYSEREVNERLGEFHEDVASLRRYLVLAGLMTRSAGGEEYRRA